MKRVTGTGTRLAGKGDDNQSGSLGMNMMPTRFKSRNEMAHTVFVTHGRDETLSQEMFSMSRWINPNPSNPPGS